MTRQEIITALHLLHVQVSMHDLFDALARVCCCRATTAYAADDEPLGQEYDRAAEWLQDMNNLHV